MITVSILIPNYNHALFLKQRIESVLNQTYQDFELIMMDDCSTDHSRQIIEEYRNHPKVSKIVYNEHNSGGVFKQWIKGIEMASGKYLWIAESDDAAEPTFLEETVRVLENDPNVGMVFTDTTIIDANGNKITTTSETKSIAYQHLASLGNVIKQDHLGAFLISELVIENASCVLFRKSNLQKIDFKELAQFTNTGDRFVYIGMALQASIILIPKALNLMRSHAHNTTKKNWENGNLHRDRLKVILYYFDRLAQNKATLQHISKLYKNHFISFVTHGRFEANITLLKKLKEKHEMSGIPFYLLSGYVSLLRNNRNQTGIIRSAYYRILMLLHHFDKDYQK